MRNSRTHPFSERKIKNLKQLTKIICRLKNAGKAIVFTNGCFDLLHYGHIKYLEEAKAKGDILVVGINSDASVRRIKGKNRPITPEFDRLRQVAGLGSVDYVVRFKEDTPLKTIKALKPNILVKGADWKKNAIVGSNYVSSYGGMTSNIKLVAGRSTTGLIKKIARRF